MINDSLINCLDFFTFNKIKPISGNNYFATADINYKVGVNKEIKIPSCKIKCADSPKYDSFEIVLDSKIIDDNGLYAGFSTKFQEIVFDKNRNVLTVSSKKDNYILEILNITNGWVE